MHSASLTSTGFSVQEKVDSLQVRFANTGDMNSIYKLRYDVFYGELGAQCGSASALEIDCDELDELCDHIIVTFRDKIVGAYRLLPKSRLLNTGHSLYSTTEFNIFDIESEYGNGLLELGRSCVHKDFRNGIIPMLMWSAIAQYLVKNSLKALIGCVSVHGLTDSEADCLWRSLSNHAHPKWSCDVTQPCRTQLPNDNSVVPLDPSKLIPPLMKGYLNMGAKVCGGPAYDRIFHCHDFLVLLETEHMSPKYFNRLFRPFQGSLSVTI